MSDKQLNMMKHAWGFDSKSPGFRTHYCESVTNEDMIQLVADGYFVGPSHVGTVGEGHGMYYLTEKGIECLKSL